MTTVEIRCLTVDDADAYWDLRLESLEREPEAFGASVESHRNLTHEEIRARISANSANNFVVGGLADGRLVGTAGFVREPGLKENHKGFVWGVYLRKEFRGMGMGRRMMQALVDRATQMGGVEQITLKVAATQRAAIELYRSLGFKPFGREERALKIGDRYIDEEYMVLLLLEKP